MFNTIRRYFNGNGEKAKNVMPSLRSHVDFFTRNMLRLSEVMLEHDRRLRAMEARITLLEAQLKDMEGEL